MLQFIRIHITEHLSRTFGIFLSVFFACLIALVGWYIATNTSRAIEHYNYNAVDPSRFTLIGSTSLLDLFGRNAGGISDVTVEAISRDSRVERVQVFRLVDIPVLARLGFFTFQFESDIPVFSVTDGVLTGSTTPLGVSRAMIEFYNTQFAGSSIMFPRMSPTFLMGKNITLTFGASKIFPPLPQVATPIEGTIVRVSDDFPGFGVVVPESLVRSKMSETGYSLGKPYKVVAYMRSVEDRGALEAAYTADHPAFDIDAITATKKRLYTIVSVITGLGLLAWGVMGMLFWLLLSGYFRERRDVFRMVSVFGLSSIRSRLLTIGEPMIILGASALVSLGILATLQHIFHGAMSRWIAQKGVSLELVPMSWSVLILIGSVVFFVGALMILLLDTLRRRKYIFR